MEKKKGGQSCGAVNCTNSRFKCPGKSFFRFPKEEKRCKQWVQNTRRQDLMNKSLDYLYMNVVICEDHFEVSQFLNASSERKQLIWNAVPTVFQVPNPPVKLTVQQRPLKRMLTEPGSSQDCKRKKTILSSEKEEMEPLSLSEGEGGNQTPASSSPQSPRKTRMSKSTKEWEQWLYHKQRVELLKDVFTLIYPKLITKGKTKNFEDKETENEARNDRLQKWLQDITQAASQEESPWGERERLDSSMNLLPQFLQLMRECILTHQWAHVLTMLGCVSHIPYGADWAIWKANLATLYTEPGDNANLVQDFFRHSYLLQECNVRDVVLEFVHYLISQGMTQEASQAIQTSRKSKKGVAGGPQHDFTKHLIDMLDAYQGLIFYVDWKAELSKKSTSSQPSSLSESFYNLTSAQGLSSDAIKIIAQRALLGLDGLSHKPGVWDIFLTKSLEIHEYYEEFEEARELLRVYRDKNPDNPNSHRFLYEFLQRNCSHFDVCGVESESISCLEGVAKLDPANPLVLTLYQKLAELGDITRGLQHSFNLLDNIVWQDREDGWLCLVQSLTACMTINNTNAKKLALQKEVKKCWSSRQDWWPAYHFNSKLVAASRGRSASCPTSSGLLLAKCIVASVLTGPDCNFCQTARKAMDKSSLMNLDMALSKLDPLTKHLKQSETSSAAGAMSESGMVKHTSVLVPDEDCELPVNFV